MKKAIVLFGLLFVFAATAQQKRTIGNYTKLYVKGSFDVTLVQGKTEATITTSDKSILESVKIEISDNVLNIYMDDHKWKNYGDIKIELPYQNLNEIHLNGSGSIAADGAINSDNIKVIVSGSGDIALTINAKNAVGELTGSGDLTLGGMTTNFEGKVIGSGDLKASRFKAENTLIEVSGSGDANVYASENIKARVVGSGDIKYAGNPKKEDTKVSGSGSIEKD
ncbi:MAG: DUF2807 domain-containing protein [Flavobacterium sp.]|nr:DUF2807 domain-containing protein [Flavobacterium sp.]